MTYWSFGLTHCINHLYYTSLTEYFLLLFLTGVQWQCQTNGSIFLSPWRSNCTLTPPIISVASIVIYSRSLFPDDLSNQITHAVVAGIALHQHNCAANEAITCNGTQMKEWPHTGKTFIYWHLVMKQLRSRLF